MPQHWRGGSARLRLRRRLVLFSAPVAVVALIAALKLISVVIAGNAAVSDFARHDADALRNDIAVLRMFNVIEPDNLEFAQGSLDALEGNLGQANSRFTDLLSRVGADRICRVRVDLELIRETQGDLAGWERDVKRAEERYTSALELIDNAPPGYFAGNSDPDAERRAIRNDASARLMHKINALHSPQPPPAPTPPPPPPPPPAAITGVVPDRLPEDQTGPALRLEPTLGDPIERLQEALGNAQAADRGGG